MALLQDVKDPVIEKVIQALEAKMDPKMKTGYQQIVVAGMRLLFDEKTHGLVMQRLQQGKQSGNVSAAIVKGTADLMAVLYKMSKQKMFMPALIPATVTLMGHIFDLAEHAGMVRVTPQIFAAATKIVTVKVLQRFGISRQQLAKGVDDLKAHRQAGNPDIPAEYGAFQ